MLSGPERGAAYPCRQCGGKDAEGHCAKPEAFGVRGGSNKLVSQIASNLRKPHYFIEIALGHEQGFLWPLDNKWLPSVGPQLATTLNTAGLRQIEHIARAPVEELALLVGKGSAVLHGFALGNVPFPVICAPAEAKSYGEQETFNPDTTDETFILARLRTMADSLMRRVRNDRKSIRCVTLRLCYNDMAVVQRSTTLPELTALENDMCPLLAGLLKRALERRVSVRLVALKYSKMYEACLLSLLPLQLADRSARITLVTRMVARSMWLMRSLRVE